MKKLLGICAALLLSVLAIPAYAATSVTGIWTGDGNGFSLTFTFT